MTSITTIKKEVQSDWVGRTGGNMAMLLKGYPVKQWGGNSIIWIQSACQADLGRHGESVPY